MQTYAEVYWRILNYLQTLAYQGVNPLVAIQLALADNMHEDNYGGGGVVTIGIKMVPNFV